MSTCYQCDHDDRETTHQTIRFDDDTPTTRKPLCAVCVRRLREAENAVRSIT